MHMFHESFGLIRHCVACSSMGFYRILDCVLSEGKILVRSHIIVIGLSLYTHITCKRFSQSLTGHKDFSQSSTDYGTRTRCH
jgi:hypothetical protein